MTWKSFLLKQRGHAKAKIGMMKFDRRLTWEIARMLANPKHVFPPPHKFINLGEDENYVIMTPEARRERIERLRKYKMK